MQRKQKGETERGGKYHGGARNVRHAGKINTHSPESKRSVFARNSPGFCCNDERFLSLKILRNETSAEKAES